MVNLTITSLQRKIILLKTIPILILITFNMKKQQQQIEAILELLQEEGLSIEQIEENLNFSIERRTLQRRLKELKESNNWISF